MFVPRKCAVAVLSAVLGAGSAVAEPSGSAPACGADLPAGLAAPPGSALAFELRAEGVQIYACTATGGAFAWTFKSPEAKLTELDGRPAGTHSAGPTWEASDGSQVVGAKVAAATPDPASVPWLLLRAASHAGSGRMSGVGFVQRVKTSGGNAPLDGCSADRVGAVARVPYRAAYCFLRAAPAAGR